MACPPEPITMQTRPDDIIMKLLRTPTKLRARERKREPMRGLDMASGRKLRAFRPESMKSRLVKMQSKLQNIEQPRDIITVITGIRSGIA